MTACAARALEVSAVQRFGTVADVTLSGEIALSGFSCGKDAFGGSLAMPSEYSSDGREFADVRIISKKLYSRLLSACKGGEAYKAPYSPVRVKVMALRHAQKKTGLDMVDVSFDDELAVTFGLLKVERKTGVSAGSSYMRLYSPRSVEMADKDFYNFVRDTVIVAAGGHPAEKKKRGGRKKHETD